MSYSKMIVKKQNFKDLPFTLEPVLKIVREKNKGDVKNISVRVTKHASKKLTKVKLIWIDYKQLIMHCSNCIFRSTDYLSYLLPMFPLVYFLQHLLKECKGMKPNGKISKEGPMVLSFVWEKKNYTTEVKFSY